MVFSSDFTDCMNSIQLVASDQVRGWLWKSLYLFLRLGPITQETFMVRPGLISDTSLSAAHFVSERCPDTNTQAMSAGKHCIVCIWWKNSSKVQPSDHSTSPPAHSALHPALQTRHSIHLKTRYVPACLPCSICSWLAWLLLIIQGSAYTSSSRMVLATWKYVSLPRAPWDLWVYASSPFQPVSHKSPGILATFAAYSSGA